MPRLASSSSISEIIEEAVQRVVGRASKALHQAVRQAAKERERREGDRSSRRSELHRKTPGRIHRRPEEMTRWVADNAARRVPKFVIEATGLDTKKKIVARFGPNVAFEKDKPLPPASPSGLSGSEESKSLRSLTRSRKPRRGASGASAEPVEAQVVKAKPPIIRKGAARAS